MFRTRVVNLSSTLCAAALTATAGVALALTGASAATAAMPMCHNADVRATYVFSDAATSHRYGYIVLRNRSGHSCTVYGYPGVSYVGDGNGTQIGAAADRVSPAPHTVILAPGRRARAQISETVAQAYSASMCRPHHVDGFRVYVPGSRLAQYIPHPTTGCANPRVHLLSVRPFTR